MTDSPSKPGETVESIQTDSVNEANPSAVQSSELQSTLTLKAAPIYVASRASIPERGQMWRDYRERGIPITSTWIDESGEGETGDFGELWGRIAKEIANSRALVLYAEAADFPLKGAFIEAGIALGMGKPVIVCLPDLGLLNRTYRPIGSWIAHPLVTRCDNIDAAVALASKPVTCDQGITTEPKSGPASSPCSCCTARGCICLPESGSESSNQGISDLISRSAVIARLREVASRQDDTFGYSAAPVLNAVADKVSAMGSTSDGWRPIETAPKDGRSFLVGLEHSELVDRAFFMNGELLIIGGRWQPTHWMPLPAPPITQAASGLPPERVPDESSCPHLHQVTRSPSLKECLDCGKFLTESGSESIERQDVCVKCGHQDAIGDANGLCARRIVVGGTGHGLEYADCGCKCVFPSTTPATAIAEGELPRFVPAWKDDDPEPSELCRMPRGHQCWIRCDERSDTHYNSPQLENCPLCNTDSPQITWGQTHYPEIFCRSCGITLTECDIPSLVKTWNTRAYRTPRNGLVPCPLCHSKRVEEFGAAMVRCNDCQCRAPRKAWNPLPQPDQEEKNNE